MSSPALDRKSLEEYWQQRLRDAELRLTFCRQYVKEVQRDFPSSGRIYGADGSYAIQHALRAETLAAAEYRRILKIFSDLVLHDKTPDAAAHSDQIPQRKS